MSAPLAGPVSYLAAMLLGHTAIPAKDGVEWEKGAEKASLSLLAAIYRAMWAVDLSGLGPFVVTSIFDSSEHLENSYHYKGRAADIRTRHLGPDGAQRMWGVIAEAVGPGFDVILEVDHIHIEHDPREANAGAAYKGTR